MMNRGWRYVGNVCPAVFNERWGDLQRCADKEAQQSIAYLMVLETLARRPPSTERI